MVASLSCQLNNLTLRLLDMWIHGTRTWYQTITASYVMAGNGARPSADILSIIKLDMMVKFLNPTKQRNTLSLIMQCYNKMTGGISWYFKCFDPQYIAYFNRYISNLHPFDTTILYLIHPRSLLHVWFIFSCYSVMAFYCLACFIHIAFDNVLAYAYTRQDLTK